MSTDFSNKFVWRRRYANDASCPLTGDQTKWTQLDPISARPAPIDCRRNGHSQEYTFVGENRTIATISRCLLSAAVCMQMTRTTARIQWAVGKVYQLVYEKLIIK